MSWRWRKRIGRGPFRINLTKKGIGYSVGIPGLRFGRSPSGQKYVSQGIPGTGLYRIKYFGRKKPQAANPPSTTVGSPPIVQAPAPTSSRPLQSVSSPRARAAMIRTYRAARSLALLMRRGLQAAARQLSAAADGLRTRQQAGWTYAPPPVTLTPPSVSPTGSPAAPPVTSSQSPQSPSTPPGSSAPQTQDPWWKQKLEP